MAKNSDHYFKVMPGDAERLFRGVDCETEGLYWKLARIAFDSTPCGFLVDHHQRPQTTDLLADCVYMKSSRFKVVLQQLVEQLIIPTAQAYEAGLAAIAVANRRAAGRLAILRTILVSIVAPAADVYVVPAILDQYLEKAWGVANGSKGGNPDLLPGPLGVVKGVDNHPPGGEGLTGVDKPQAQRSHSHSGSFSESGSRKRKATAAARDEEPLLRTQPSPTSAPWSWRKHVYECDQVRKWRSKLPPDMLDDRDRYAAAFQQEFGYELAVFEIAQECWQHGPESAPVPQSCIEGRHVADASGACSECGQRFLGGVAG